MNQERVNQDVVSLFRHLTLGVYVIGVAHGAERDAFTAAAVMQTSYQPLILAIAINPEHASYPILPGADKMQGVAWRTARLGAPILSEALAFFECAVKAEMPAGDHRIVLGQVLDGAILNAGTPMKYADTHN